MPSEEQILAILRRTQGVKAAPGPPVEQRKKGQETDPATTFNGRLGASDAVNRRIQEVSQGVQSVVPEKGYSPARARKIMQSVYPTVPIVTPASVQTMGAMERHRLSNLPKSEQWAKREQVNTALEEAEQELADIRKNKLGIPGELSSRLVQLKRDKSTIDEVLDRPGLVERVLEIARKMEPAPSRYVARPITRAILPEELGGYKKEPLGPLEAALVAMPALGPVLPSGKMGATALLNKLGPLGRKIVGKQMQQLSPKAQQKLVNAATQQEMRLAVKEGRPDRGAVVGAQVKEQLGKLTTREGGVLGMIRGRPAGYTASTQVREDLLVLSTRADKRVAISPAVKEKFSGIYRRVQEELTDARAGINKTARDARKRYREKTGRNLPVELDGEYQAVLVDGAVAAGMQRGTEALVQARRLADSQFLDEYLALKHAVSVAGVMGEGRLLGGGALTLKEAKAQLIKIQKHLGVQKFKELKEGAQVIWNAYDDLLNRKVAAGLVAKEDARLLRKKFPYYNPIGYIDILDDALAIPGASASKRLSVASASEYHLGKQGLHATQEKPSLMMAQAFMRGEMLVQRNMAAKAIISNARLDPILSKQIKDVTLSKKIKGHTISYMTGGEKVTWQVPKWLEHEAKTLANMPFGSFEQTAMWLNSYGRAALVTLEPVFMVGNFLFDAMTVSMTRGVTPWRTTVALLKNLSSLFRTDKGLAAFKRAGADFSGYWGRPAQELVRKAELEGDIVLRSMADWKRLFGSPKRMLDTVRQVGHLTELAPRRAVFEKVLQEGKGVQFAAVSARRATVDFARAGRGIRLANAAFLFLNPAVQGMLLPGRVLTGSDPTVKAKVARIGVASYMATHLALYAWNRQFPEYHDMSLHDKYGKIQILLPSNETNKYGKTVAHKITIIPVLREWAAFSAPMLYALGKLDGEAPEDVGAFLKAVVPQLFPVTESSDLLNFATLPGKMILELNKNWDSFSKRPIVPRELEGLPPSEQFDEYTSETAKRLGKFLNVSPKRIDFMISLGVLRDAIAGADMALRALDGEDLEVIEHVAELESITELSPQNEVMVRRKEYLRALDSDLRKRVEAADRAPKPAIPFVTRLQQRFFNKTSGNTFWQGVTQATREFGYSEEQTRAAAQVIGNAFEEIQPQEDARDTAVSKWLDGDRSDEALSLMDWRGSGKDTRFLWEAIMLSLQTEFPRSMQVEEDPKRRAAYWDAVYTTAGQFPDTRTQAQLLVATNRAISVPDLPNGEPDMRTYFKLKREFMEGLSEEQRKLLDRENRATMTDIEIIYDKSLDALRPYFNITEDVLESYGDEDHRLSNQYDRWRRLDPNEEAVYRKLKPGLENALKVIELQRAFLRERNQLVDAARVAFWGSTPRHKNNVDMGVQGTIHWLVEELGAE